MIQRTISASWAYLRYCLPVFRLLLLLLLLLLLFQLLYRRGDGRHKTSTFRWEWGISSYIWMWISVFVCLQVCVCLCVCILLASARHFTRRNFMYKAKVLGWVIHALSYRTHISKCLQLCLAFALTLICSTHTQTHTQCERERDSAIAARDDFLNGCNDAKCKCFLCAIRHGILCTVYTVQLYMPVVGIFSFSFCFSPS